MALIALRNIRCIDYLAYGAIFTRAVFPFVTAGTKKRVFGFPPKKPKMSARQQQLHHQQLTNGSTILKTFTFPEFLDLFKLIYSILD